MLDLTTGSLTVVALFCFAANSILCRLALAPNLIDASSFATVRVTAAAAILTMLVVLSQRRLPRFNTHCISSIVSLFAYIIFFSLAYTRISTGVGALVLFGSVQVTMIGFALWQGERLPTTSWVAFGVAIIGLAYLVSPGMSAPEPIGAIFMILSGTAWALFSLSGRSKVDPIDSNAVSFIGCVPLALIANAVFSKDFSITTEGFLLAVASGAIASGLGYAVWYAALRKLTITHASTVQLLVPALAAFGGAVLLSEPITFRLLLASGALLGSVAVIILKRSRTATSH
ncbi:DMT family transporter [Bradyrhizobium prioriisuperbiae]|uniref:DMT family transporter n=1 Tax=Bradyrhizobium prioriisuperbiae TaxID=2854389 RepID=UPI0028E9082E|nr:DMT family transporter [Bradyrhizobium prioritasuperba]